MLRLSGIRTLCWMFILVFALSSGCKNKQDENHDQLTICFVGDLLLDRGVRKQISQHGPGVLFEQVKPLFRKADAVVANLECPVTKSITPVSKKYIFRGEPEWLKAIKESGITHLVMANNHSYDQGRTGIRETYSNLLANQLIPVGYGTNQENACKPVIIQKGNIKVALFSSVILPLENWSYLPDSCGMCQASIDDLKTQISDFKKVNQGYKVVVILHWGAEFQETPQPGQRQQAEELIDAGADAIIGHHPHVVQPYSIYKGKPIFYSIGNFVFDQEYEPATKAILVQIVFSEKGENFSIKQLIIKNCIPFQL
jgi:poly-gamma-glutamate capsule biosynthesis protein CapA/YwtB (metallophosphatase superfamily)